MELKFTELKTANYTVEYDGRNVGVILSVMHRWGMPTAVEFVATGHFRFSKSMLEEIVSLMRAVSEPVGKNPAMATFRQKLKMNQQDAAE